MPGFDFFQTSPVTGNTDPLLGAAPSVLPLTAPAIPFLPGGQLPPATAPQSTTSNQSPNPTNAAVSAIFTNIAALIQGPQSTQGSSAGGVVASGANSPNAPSLTQALSQSPVFWIGAGAIVLFLAIPYFKKRGRK